jgi:hypothetical protein
MATFLNFSYPTFYPVFLFLLFQAFFEIVAVVASETEVVPVAAELSHGAVVFAAGPEVAFVAPFSIAHVSGRQVSVHIHTAFAVSIPVSVLVEEIDIFRRSNFFLFPNIGY